MTELTKAAVNEAFYDMAKDHIELANSHKDKTDPGRSGAALMFAASRFNAYVSSTISPTGQDMIANRAAHIEHYVQQYKSMLEDNFDYYLKNFEAFTGRQ